MLKEITDEELQAELDKRKAERDEKAKPQPIAEPDWSRARATVVNHVEDVLRGVQEGKDIEHYIYEQALEAVYGVNIWYTLNPFWQ